MILGRVFGLLTLAAPVFAQYAGPAILSRGDAPSGVGSAPVSFRPYFEISGIYDTGLTGAGLNAQGELGTMSSPGIQFAGGISGNHSWRHTTIGLSYRGDINHFTKATYYDASDQSLLLSIKHQFTRHIYLDLRESAGMFSTDSGLSALQQAISYDPAQSSLPTTDFFDNRTIYLDTQADLVYQRSARLSFDFGGDGFINRRRSTDLYGVTGASARGDVQYRLSRRQTIGANYTFTNYTYTRVFSGTYIHSFSGTYAIQLTRHLEFTGYAGVSHIDNTIEQLVPVSPAIAAILGITSGLAVSHTVTYVPNGSGRLSEQFHNGVAYVSGSHVVTPGNGLFLTSISTNATAGYTFTGVRRWSLGATVLYTNAQTVGETVGGVTGAYGLTSITLQASRLIAKSMHVVAAFSANRYDSPDFALYNRTIYSARLGFGWAPGDIPLRVW
ncbi:MAG: hypothetical protein ABSG03_05170 [Bryobacteraceae bacterium]